jgi:hypothetical protein
VKIFTIIEIQESLSDEKLAYTEEFMVKYA